MQTYPDCPRLSYAEVREEIQNGDFLLCSGSAFFSTIIKRTTQSIFSHVGVIYWRRDIQRLMLLESVESHGTQMIPLHRYVRNYRQTNRPYPGRLFIARHPDCARVTPAQWVTFEQQAIDLLDYVYNDAEKWHILAAIVAPYLARERAEIATATGFICSVYASTILVPIQVEIPWNPRGYIAPVDFAKEPVQILYELVP